MIGLVTISVITASIISNRAIVMQKRDERMAS
jgi:hypothetical protein